jgi:hypothetical protein
MRTKIQPLSSVVVVLVTLAMGLVVFGCGGTDSASTGSSSMKGWELYSWQEEGQWCFSLLEGTNRAKSIDEIQSPDTRLEGIEALRPALEGLESGEWVTWWDPSWAGEALEFPPADLVEEVRSVCEERGLHLTVDGASP